MAYFLFKRWKERLFSLNRTEVNFKTAKVSIEMVPVTYESINLVKELRGPEFVEQFKYQLTLGDFGYYAYYNGKPVGYGWVKHQGSDDFFFEISDGCCYLCRFFVHESMRGLGIYPELISSLIEKEQDTLTFFIAVERGNIASENGLKKVGFKFVKEFGFIRGFRKTFNKKCLREL